MKQQKSSFQLLGIILFFAATLSACKKEQVETNDDEVITSVLVKLTPTTGGNTLTYSYEDLDGPGGNNPTIQPISLQANQSYNVSLLLLNKTTNPADTISNEIINEADAHRFYFEPSANSNISVGSLDTDGNGNPLGMNSLWTTGDVSNGTIKITLRHYPGTPPNKASNDPVNSTKSSSDIEVVFDTSIQ
jgi:hypothetical protein